MLPVSSAPKETATTGPNWAGQPDLIWLPETAPWRIALLEGSAAEAATVSASLRRWLPRLPHESAMPCLGWTWPGLLCDRGFPSPFGFLWPANHPWEPLAPPWTDPGTGVLWLPLAGDPAALRAQGPEVIQRLYDRLLPDPPTATSVLVEQIHELGDALHWNSGLRRALAHDLRPLHRGEALQLWTATERDGGCFLSVHAGSGVLWPQLVALLPAVWAEAISEPRDMTVEEVEALPRTIGAHQQNQVREACRRMGAARREMLLERAADLLGGTWEIEPAEMPALHLSASGVHRQGASAVHRWGWQPAVAGAAGFARGGLGQPALAWRWTANAAVLTPGLPLHFPRLMEQKESLRQCPHWTLLDQLHAAGIPVRAGSMTLLRTWHPLAFAPEAPWLMAAQDRGWITEVRTLVSAGLVLG